jgi:hypothetical protein
MGNFRPKLNLSLLRDRISEHKHGYSFVQDPKNELRSSYLDLANDICALPEHGLMNHNGWNLRLVRQFLKKEEILLEQIMLMIYLRGGQASRTTEFFSVRCKNGASTSRGIYVHQGSMMYVTRHPKARRSTNQEFQVARYLPESDSLALATYLVYIRPLVAMIHRSAFGLERERKLLFCSLEDPNKAWRATRLTSALKRLTRDLARLEIGVRSYRQLSIAVTEKYLAHISSPFNRHEDKSGNAQLEVAFAWQSGHRPLQRGTSYGIDAAFPDPLQPALLRVYKRASGEWHRFLERGVDTPKPPTLERGKDHRLSQASQRRVHAASPITGTKRSYQDKRQRRSSRVESPEMLVSQSSDNQSSPPQWIHRTMDSYTPDDIENISRQFLKEPGNRLDTRQVNGVLIENDSMEDNRTMTTTQNIRRNTAVECFHYNAAHRVLICREHGYAVASWKRYLSDYHAFSTSDAKDAARLLKDLDVVRPENAVTPYSNRISRNAAHSGESPSYIVVAQGECVAETIEDHPG